jgi:hypothetical protein
LVHVTGIFALFPVIQYKHTIYWEQYINTRYREQYKIPVTVNNTNILITGSKTKIPVTVDNANI